LRLYFLGLLIGASIERLRHVGSQGCSLELLAAGQRKTVDLAEEINGRTGKRQVGLIDIGGGLPVNFESEEVRPTFAEYADVLSSAVPELFNGKFRGKTEFGRSIYAKNGFIASRIEYTKSAGGRLLFFEPFLLQRLTGPRCLRGRTIRR